MPTKLQLQKRIQELEEETMPGRRFRRLWRSSLPGTTRAEIENARYRALAAFRAAKKAGAHADLYISYVSSYIKELGNEESSEWDLETAVILRRNSSPTCDH